MAEARREVAIDADFFRKFTEKDKDGQLFLKVMDVLNIQPVMHEYVYEYELAGDSTVKLLKKNGAIKVYTYSDFINETNKSNYEAQFAKAYKYFNYSKYIEDIYAYHHEKESLGEIRTSLMAFYMGIDLFMSDDGAAKAFVTNRLSSRRHRIEVYNVYETLEWIYRTGSTTIKWSDIKGMAKNAFAMAMYKYDKINKLWHGLQ